MGHLICMANSGNCKGFWSSVQRIKGQRPDIYIFYYTTRACKFISSQLPIKFESRMHFQIVKVSKIHISLYCFLEAIRGYSLNEKVKQEKWRFGIQDIKNTIQEKDMKDSPEWRWREILRLMIEKVTSPYWHSWEDSGRDESKKMKSVDYLMFLNLLKGKEIYTVGEKLRVSQVHRTPNKQNKKKIILTPWTTGSCKGKNHSIPPVLMTII